MNIKTLQFWHKLEHFYPYVIAEQTSPNIATFTIDSPGRFDELLRAPLPRGKTVRYYAVYLGLFRVDKALAALEQGIGRKMRFRDSSDDASCFCTFTMNSGLEFNSNSFKISSFPWAIHRVRDGKIIIDQWDDDFHAFESDAFLRLYDHNEACGYDFLLGLRDWFAGRMNWNIEYCGYWMRIDMVMGDAEDKDAAAEPELDGDDVMEAEASPKSEESQAENMDTDEQVKQNDLLNSFYIRDLERIIDRVKKEGGTEKDCFQLYLKHNAEKQIDIESDRDSLFALLSPRLLPKGKWPSGYGLRLMQQVDVNAFLCEEPGFNQPLFSVNGPPGTGKTTLLKDIIAAIVTERAAQMCGLEMPDDAFGGVVCGIETVTPRGTYTNLVRDIKPELKRYGILVTSNNNGAVENITHTLPSSDGISAGCLDNNCRYFSEISDLLFGESKTWALNAAALGNKYNRQRFADAFWPISRDHKGYNFNRELYSMVKNPDRPGWENAKQAFLSAMDAARREYQRAEDAYTRLGRLRAARKELETLNANIQTEKSRLAGLNLALSKQSDRADMLEQQQNHFRTMLRDIEKSHTFFWLKRLFLPNAPFMRDYRSLQREMRAQVSALLSAREKSFAAKLEVQKIEALLKERQERTGLLDAEISRLERLLDIFKEQTGSPLSIDAYFGETLDEAASKSSPWGYDSLNQCREKLFMEAMALHKAFVQNSKYLRENLDAFSKLLRGKIPADQLPAAAPVLLQSFMLIVPVVSTTFASVGTFLRYIPRQEIAYLFVDEAGQAMPQSAAGAIWRARKAIAVGDPLQIELVVTLHDSVISALAGHYGQSALIANKYTSVQSLADQANQLGGFRTVTEENDLWIGAPLIVHNRCQKKVFDISNAIAYNGKMLRDDKNESPHAKCEWLHVSGNSQNGHYVPSQAEAISQLVLDAFAIFADERDKSRKYPAIFVISPFRSVRSGIAAYFRKNLSSNLKRHGIRVSDDIVRKWIKACIGTIHTFQGKETDTVVLCLGVGTGGKNAGAVDWACERPNILNVAITRSKKNLYIVGDRTIWAEKPYFKTAFEMCG